jgi:hypothetical protein
MNARLSNLGALLPIERPRNEPHRGRPQSPERRAVESVLRSATREKPVSAVDVAQRCRLATSAARAIVNNIVQRGWAHNTTPGVNPSLYAWGPPPAAPVDASRYEAPEGSYNGAELRPFSGRPGAMRAYELPSLVDGQRVERRAPILIGRKPDVRR